MTKKTAKPAATPPPKPGSVLGTRAHYRQAVIRLVRRQLDCARRELIGTPEWEMALGDDFRFIRRYSALARIPAPEVDYREDDYFTDPFTGEQEMTPAGWYIKEGIPTHRLPTERESQRIIGITDNPHDPAVRRAVNLLATHVLEEWLEWIETADERTLDHDMMPAAYFEPLQKANPENLRKWRDAGKIAGTKPGGGREITFSVVTVLKHLKLPAAATRSMLDARWLEAQAPELAKRKDEVRERVTGKPTAETRGMSRNAPVTR